MSTTSECKASSTPYRQVETHPCLLCNCADKRFNVLVNQENYAATLAALRTGSGVVPPAICGCGHAFSSHDTVSVEGGPGLAWLSGTA